MNQNSIFILIIIIGFLILVCQKLQESYSDYHVNYPLDAYPDDPIALKAGGRKDPGFLVKLPYDNLTTRHYKQLYLNKTTPKCVSNGTCDSSPGYYKSYPDYFTDPNKLKSYYLGYSITGYPYNDYFFPSDSAVNLREPESKFDYPTWYDYQQPRKEAKYYGYPFYFGGKPMS